MDKNKYISSGLLELYVLGLGSEKDRKEIEQYMVKDPSIRAEVTKIEKAFQLYAEAFKIPVSTGLEQQILKEVSETKQETNTSTISSPKTASNNGLLYLFGVLLIGALALTYWFYNKNQSSAKQLDKVQTEFRVLKEACAKNEANLLNLNQQIDILLNTENQRIDMAGSKLAPAALASVYYNKETQKSYLNLGSLPITPKDKKYELWALVDGNPVSMGQFEVSTRKDSTIIEVPFIENVGAFAVTLELLDGDAAPNLEQLYAIGETS